VSPPLIPDGRISRVRLAAAAYPQRTFPHSPRFKYSSTYTPGPHSYTSGSTPSEVHCNLALSPDSNTFTVPATYREPLRLRQELPSSGWCHTPPRRALPLLHRSYGLMRPTETLSPTQVFPLTASLCRLLRAPAGSRRFPTLSLQSLYRCLGPYPAAFFWCSCPFLPRRQRPHVSGKTFGTLKVPCHAASTGRL
jgi:hypothetical protein